MRVVYLAAGAAGMYCGSCIRDNRLAATLRAQGRDVLLIPLYTPVRTDEADVSERRVYYGGINVFLQQKSAIFRHTPAFLDGLFDTPALLKGVGRFAAKTRAEDLGALTLSVLKGEHGAQRKELEKLIHALRELKPGLVHLPNLMFLGIAHRLKEALGIPVLCTLSGEDLFLDGLPEPYRREAFELVRTRAADVDAYVAATRYYAEHAIRHFSLPAERVYAVRLGIQVGDVPAFAGPPPGPFTIGYFARICPEKGLLQLCEAFAALRRAGRDCRLRFAGYLGAGDKPYLERIQTYLAEQGLGGAYDHAGELDRRGKYEFLQSLHVLSVPTPYHEAKGLYILEANAAGTPVVQPRHGSFPELVEATGGGLLYDPGEPNGLMNELARLMDDEELRKKLAAQGRVAVHASFMDEIMARETWAIYERYAKAAKT